MTTEPRKNKPRRHPNSTTSKSQTLPSSPTHSSSSSEFEFSVSLSPRKSSTALCPADELFYKGQLLPLHLSPRLSLVRTLLLSSASTSSSSDTTTTASRDSTASSSSDSSRPSSATDDELKPLTSTTTSTTSSPIKPSSSKYFSLSKFSSVFRHKDHQRVQHKNVVPPPPSSSSMKRAGSSAKEVIRKYFNKVKPLYEKLSHKQVPTQQHKVVVSKVVSRSANSTSSSTISMTTTTTTTTNKDHNRDTQDRALSFSGNLRYPRAGRRSSCISSCPSSMGSSPSHGRTMTQMGRTGSGNFNSETSTMDELQSAIQGAIAHCKNSMLAGG